MSHSVTLNHQAVELIERFALCLLQNKKTKDDIHAIKELAQYITYFSNFAELSIKQDDTFKKFADMVNSSTEELDPVEVLEKFNEELEKAKDNLKNGEKCAKYKQFMKIIEKHLDDGNDGDDDDDNIDDENKGSDKEIETVSESVNTIDPITKLPIVEPVKNKNCGHSYEKKSILQLIANNPKTRCPIPGCCAANVVKKKDLIPDHALKRLLSQSYPKQ